MTIIFRQACFITTFISAMKVILVLVMFKDSTGGNTLLVHKYSTRVVRTKYGPLRGVIIHIHPPVEAFLGVPYATPPVGSLRYMPPVTPSIWRNTRLADRFGAVCPQSLPDISNRSEALLEYPKSRLFYLEKLLPQLTNQSEDCLYLNIYVPRTVTGEEETNLLPCLVYVHGESYEWNSGNPYDGTVLAANGRIIVVTINFRLGVLGFLKTGTKGSAQGNFGLMDLVAGLHWLRENLSAFGGDPQRITIMGHDTGAALVNFISVSPVAKELLHRVILLSGSGLSPWAIQRDPLWVKRSVAKHTGCHGDLYEDDLAPCLRLKPLSQLLSIKLDTPRFLPGFAPFIDGTMLINPISAPPTISSSSTISASGGYELADFPDRDLLFCLTSTESFLDLNAQDLEFGFNETKRDRILRTYVRNSYFYHLNEIFSTLKNEYTDWERPSQNPLSVRDATLDLLSDGHTAAPLIRVGYLHSMKGGKSFFLHFLHHSDEKNIPMRTGSVRGEDLPYLFGLPLVGSGLLFSHNYSHSDATTSKVLIDYVSNFIKKGDPNSFFPNASSSEPRNSRNEREKEDESPYWDSYDTINQFYLELGHRSERKDHYRGHKMSLWLNLIPQLHTPGDADMSMRHHHFQEEDDQYYDGFVRPQTKEKPPYAHFAPPPAVFTTPRTTTTSTSTPSPPKSDTALQATTTECPPNTTLNLNSNKNTNHLLRKLASSHYQSYTTALTVTIAVGCFLLLLNILIFAGIYHQRDRSKSKGKKKEEAALASVEGGSCSTSSGEAYDKVYETQQIPTTYCDETVFGRTSFMGEYTLDSKPSLADIQMTELPLQQFTSSPPPAKRKDGNSHSRPPDVTSTAQEVHCIVSPSELEPPPPPKSHALTPVSNNQTGILRPHGAPVTPGSMKKRVQIQEISV